MRFDLNLLAGNESKGFLTELTKIVERFEKAATRFGSGTDGGTTKDVPPMTDELEEDDAEFTPKKTTKKSAAKASFDDEDEEETETEVEADEDDAPKVTTKGKKAAKASFDDEEESDEDETPAPKKTKAKKTTLDDVNDACKERALRGTRAEVLSILKKNFGVKSVSELEASDYEAAVKALSKK